MPRKARLVIPHTAHHVVQRGNYRQFVFEQDQDFRKYSYWIQRYSHDYQVQIHAYCLMGNHVHFIVTPAERHGLAEMFKNVHMLYSQYKNTAHQRQGHLWQGRFYSCVLSASHLSRALRYVEMNPVRAGIVVYPWDYPWSSARQHTQREKAPIIRTMISRQFIGKEPWDEYLLKKDEGMTADIRRKTRKGLAIGEKDFIVTLERQYGIILSEKKAGRPKKSKK